MVSSIPTEVEIAGLIYEYVQRFLWGVTHTGQHIWKQFQTIVGYPYSNILSNDGWMVERSNLIQVASDEWIVMREFAQYPKAIIRGMRDASGEARFILCSWHPVRHKQHMMGLYESKEAAEAAVPWPTRTPPVPSRPEMGRPQPVTPDTVDINGYPPGTPDRRRVDGS